MTHLWTAGQIVFVYDDETSDKYMENYRAEHDMRHLRLQADLTTLSPYFELFEEFKVGTRWMHNRLFATSDINKMRDWIIINIQQ